VAHFLQTDSPAIAALLCQSVSSQRLALWTERTSLPFDPMDSIAQLTHRDVICPKCGSKVAQRKLACAILTVFRGSSPREALFQEDGTGYLQKKSAIECRKQKCKFLITRETLAVHKLVKAIYSDDHVAWVPSYPLPGSISSLILPVVERSIPQPNSPMFSGLSRSKRKCAPRRPYTRPEQTLMNLWKLVNARRWSGLGIP